MPDLRGIRIRASALALLLAGLVLLPLCVWWLCCWNPATTVLLVRHAEKEAAPANDPPLSPAGQSRAQELARALGDAGISAVYASQFVRTQQTAQPLATRLGLAVTVVSSSDTQLLVDQILAGHSGGHVLVAGHSDTVPSIIVALGGPQISNIPDTQFDNLYIVTKYRHGGATLVRIRYGAPTP